MGGELTAGVRGFGDREPTHSDLVPPITWTCVLGAHKRCHPRGGDTGPASASFGPGSVLGRYDKGIYCHARYKCLPYIYTHTYTIAMCTQKLFTNKSHAPSKDKDAIQCSNFHKLISFISVVHMMGKQI